MIAADNDDRAGRTRQLFDGAEEHLLRLGGRHIGIKDVPGNKDEVDALALADNRERVKRLNLFGQAFPIHQALADMPVRSV